LFGYKQGNTTAATLHTNRALLHAPQMIASTGESSFAAEQAHAT
jgi:hypothetical protein